MVRFPNGSSRKSAFPLLHVLSPSGGWWNYYKVKTCLAGLLPKTVSFASLSLSDIEYIYFGYFRIQRMGQLKKQNSLQLNILNKAMDSFVHLFHISFLSAYYGPSTVEGTGTRKMRRGSCHLGTENSSVGRQVNDQAHPARVSGMFGTSASACHSVCVQIFVKGILKEWPGSTQYGHLPQAQWWQCRVFKIHTICQYAKLVCSCGE